MSIGSEYSSSDSTTNGGAKRLFENTYYSRIKMRKDGADKALTFEFRSGLLVMKIMQIEGQYGFAKDPVESISISPTKALILSNELDKFIKYLESGKIDEKKGFGINGGMGEKISYVAFHAKKDKTILITIGKFDGEGNIVQSDTVELNKEYHYGLEWNDVSTMDIERSFNDTVEIQQIVTMIRDFARFMNGAAAYSQADLVRYDTARILKKMDPIYEKLGIERISYNNQGINNFLSNSSVKSESKSLDDLISLDD